MDPIRTALAAAALAVAFHAPQDARAAGTSWLCGLSEEGTQLVCIADLQLVDSAEAPAATTAVVNGTRFPLDPQSVYIVEMWSRPTDPEWVQLLARSTICCRSPGCEVTMASGPVWRQMVAMAPTPQR